MKLTRPFWLILTCLSLEATAQDVLHVPEPSRGPNLYRLPESADEILPSLEAHYWEVHKRAKAIYFGPPDEIPEGVKVHGRQLMVPGRFRPDLIPLQSALSFILFRLVDGDMTFERDLIARGFDPKDFPWLRKGTGELSHEKLINRRIEDLEMEFWAVKGHIRNPTKKILRDYLDKVRTIQQETKLAWAEQVLGPLTNPSKRALINYLLEKQIRTMGHGFSFGAYHDDELEEIKGLIMKKAGKLKGAKK